MPWKETGRVFERTRFIEDYLSGCFTISELASRYHVSRKTLYKWLARHDTGGLAGLRDRSRAPVACPHRTPEAVEEAVVEFRRRFPFMGPKKIIARLSELEPGVAWPAPSTVGEILDRCGLVERRKRRHPSVHPSRMPVKPTEPNDVMTIDFKGQFRLGNHEYCYPLTIVDGYSRYILACDALTSTRTRTRGGSCSASFASTACLDAFSRTMAHRSPHLASGISLGFLFGGFAWASESSESRQETRNRTERTSGCTKPSRNRPRGRQPATRRDNSGSSTRSYTSSTKSAPTKRSDNVGRRRCTRRRPGHIRSGCRESSTRGGSKPGSSPTTAM